jgi:hypothetical protein
MNGRMYDPLLGRFLSPEPYVQAPDFSQSFNRYSYCLNNPLVYTDPEGEWIHIVIGAVIGGVVNLAAHWNQIDDIGDGLKAFGIGAAGGALAAFTGGAVLGAFGAGVGAGGFVGGAVSSGVGYLYGTTATGIGNAAVFGDPMPTGKQLIAGTGIAMVTGGILNGGIASIQGRNFWNGSMPVQAPPPVVPNINAPEVKINEEAFKPKLNALGNVEREIVGERYSTIYRAVSQAEVDDIAKVGFRMKSGGYETGKLFAPTLREATQFGKYNFRLDGVPNTIMKVKVPDSVLNGATQFGADGMNAISIPANQLHLLKAKPLNYSPWLK